LSFNIGLQKTIQQRQKGFPLPSLTQLRQKQNWSTIRNFPFKTNNSIFLTKFDEFEVYAEPVEVPLRTLKIFSINNKQIFAYFTFKKIQ